VPSQAHVALLRGINVGGKNKLPMAELVALFRAAGARSVRTHIQSGNVLFGAEPKALGRLVRDVEARLAKKLGGPIPLAVRNARDLVRVSQENPYLAAGIDPAELHVAFLAARPEKRRLAALDPRRSPGDAFTARGSELYLHLPNGVARTKLTNAYFDATLGTTSTLRNWRTVATLVTLVGTPVQDEEV
jgi:uncharacterized protein (DUF1697 family)